LESNDKVWEAKEVAKEKLGKVGGMFSSGWGSLKSKVTGSKP